MCVRVRACGKACPERARAQVSWEGLQDATAADAVALLMPPDVDLQAAVPLKYKWTGGRLKGSATYVLH